MTTIVIEEGKLYLDFTKGIGASVGTYTPYVFEKGGKEAINPRTRESVITEDKWVKRELYFTNLIHALRWCAQELVHMENPSMISLDDYLKRCEAVWKQ